MPIMHKSNKIQSLHRGANHEKKRNIVSFKNMMSLWPAVSLITYVGLSIGLVVVLEEPYNLYKKNDTTKIADTIESEGLGERKYPTFVICEAQPLTKKAEGLASAEEAANYSRVFTNYVGKAANWRADEFIEGFLLTRSLVYGQPVPLSLDDFRPLVVSFFRFGVCFAKDLGPEIESDKGMSGMDPEAVYSTSFILSFKADPPGTRPEDQSQYGVFILDPGEELMLSGPVVMMEEAGVALTSVAAGRGTILRIQQEFHQNVNNCSLDNRKMSDCVSEYMGNNYGSCRQVPLVDGSSEEEGACNPVQLLQQGFFLETLKTEGLEAIDARTTCQLPCQRMSYRTFTLVEDVGEIVFPDLALMVRQMRMAAAAAVNASADDVNTSLTAMAFSLPRLPKMRRVREVPNYPPESFGGEVGGYIGMFLGLSVWGIFSIAKDLLLMAHGRVAVGEKK